MRFAKFDLITNLRLLALLGFCLHINIAYAENAPNFSSYSWEWIGTSTWAGKPQVMIGKNSIIGSGITSNYSFVTKTEYSNPVESRGVQVRWVGQSWRVHCNSRKLSLMHSYFFDKNGNNVKEQESSGSILPSTPSQFQLGDKLVDYVCSHLNEAEERNSGASQGDVTPVNPAPTEKQRISFGTAWLSDTGYFITAFHVIENAKSISLAVGRNQVLDASLINADKINDIAILFADLRNTNMRGLAITKGYPKLGSRIFTLGFPHPDLMGCPQNLLRVKLAALMGWQMTLGYYKSRHLFSPEIVVAR